jgi:hypothetical protein
MKDRWSVAAVPSDPAGHDPTPSPTAEARAVGKLWLRTPTVAVAAFLVMVAAVGYRTHRFINVPGQPHAQGWALQDFRDAIYYPVAALLDGANPYDADAYLAHYPVGNSFPMYTPLMLLVHLPFGLLPYTTAELVYFLATTILVVALAALTLKLCGLQAATAPVFALGALVLVSEPGQWNLYLGQSAATITVATYAALYWARRRPWLAAAGVALVMIKPTSAIPLIVLLSAAGRFTIVVGGVALAALLSAVPAALVLRNAGGLGAFLGSLRGNYAQFAADPTANAATSDYRVDVVALVARFLGRPLEARAEILLMLCVLGIAGLALMWLNRSHRNGFACQFETSLDTAREKTAPTRDERKTASESTTHPLAPSSRLPLAAYRGVHPESPGKAYRNRAEPLSAGIICLAVLLCTYHQTYEVLLAAVPLVALAHGRLGPTVAARPWVRWIGAAALAVPAINYLVDGWTLNRLRLTGLPWLALASLNGAALLIGFGALLMLAYGARTQRMVLTRRRVAARVGP